jgi:hypothetical protein
MTSSPEFEDWVARARESDLVEVAEKFGAKLKRSGAERIGACPAGCSMTDGFAINVRDRVFICRKGGAQGDVISLAQHLGGYDFKGACEFLTGEPPPRSGSAMKERDPELDKQRREERRDAAIEARRKEAAEIDEAVVEATKFFEAARQITETVVEDYLERRGIAFHGDAVTDLRFVPHLAYYGFADKDAETETQLGAFHAMIAPIRNVAGQIIGIHRTFIDKSGPIGLRPPGDRLRNKKKKILWKSKGGLIRLGQVGETLAIGEGIETTLSFRQMLHEGLLGEEHLDATFAAGIALGNMAGRSTRSVPHPNPPKNNPRATIRNGEPDMAEPGMILPDVVRTVILLGDGDSEPAMTRATLLTAARRFRNQGLDVRVCMAPGGMDFNDLLLDTVAGRATEHPPISTLEAFEEASRPYLSPPPFVSRFKALRFTEIDLPGTEHEWLIKGVITRGERCMMVGASQSGKSFLAIDLAMAIARGVEWFGNWTRRGGVIYQAGEGGRGIKKRVRAYRMEHSVDPGTNLPFILMPAPLDLFGGDDQAKAFIDESKYWASTFALPLEMVVIDTLSTATPGADENSSKDIGPVLGRCERIGQELNCAVMLVHHMNAGGQKPRGHTSIMANLDSVLKVEKLEEMDIDKRSIREIDLVKQKDGESGRRWRFVLPAVEVGRDGDGDPITSCVIRAPNFEGEPGETSKPTDAGIRLTPQCEVFLRAIYRALTEHGEDAPEALQIPRGTRVVRWKKLGEVFAGMAFDGADEADPKKRQDKLSQAMKRHGERLVQLRVMMREAPFVWLTGRKVRGFAKRDDSAEARRKAIQETQPAPEVEASF